MPTALSYQTEIKVSQKLSVSGTSIKMFETADHSKTKQLNALKSFGRVTSQDFKQYLFKKETKWSNLFSKVN